MTPTDVQHAHDRLADGAAGVAVVAAGVSLSHALQIVQIVAGCVAIVSGLCAICYYVKRTWGNQR